MKQVLALLFLIVLFDACCPDTEAVPCQIGLEANLTQINDTVFTPCLDCVTFGCVSERSYDQRYGYEYPVFNPNNANELAFLKKDFQSTQANELSREVVIYNFCTSETKIIASDAFYGLDWSVRGWLIYTGTDRNIWKVKSNGDSLTQMTFDGNYNNFPKFSFDGESFIYTKQSSNFGWLLRSDNTGVNIDTITDIGGKGKWSWYDESQLIHMHVKGNLTSAISLHNILTNVVSDIHTLSYSMSNDSLVIQTTKLNDHSLLWCALRTIGITDINTGTYKVIENKIPNVQFEAIAVSPDQQRIVINYRYIDRKVDNCTYSVRYKFKVVDLNGENDMQINIPE
jgi:hypothetical protein